MGSWNHTCAVTNLPIHAGEEVEVILLKAHERQDDYSFCYPDAYYTPFPLTFSGKYNDYGSVEDCHGVALELIVSEIQKNLLEMEVGENEYHDIAAKKEGFDVEELFNLDHEGRLFIVNRKTQYDMREGMRVKHIVIRKEVYEGIIAGMTFEKWDREKSQYDHLKYEDLVEECKQFTEDMEDIIGLEQTDALKIYWMMDGVIGETMVSRMLANRGEGSYGADYPIRLVEMLFNMHKEGHEDYEAMLDNALRLSILTRFMRDGRKSWHVPSGVGSQDQETDAQELCAKLTLSSAEIVNHYYDEDE